MTEYLDTIENNNNFEHACDSIRKISGASKDKFTSPMISVYPCNILAVVNILRHLSTDQDLCREFSVKRLLSRFERHMTEDAYLEWEKENERIDKENGYY